MCRAVEIAYIFIYLWRKRRVAHVRQRHPVLRNNGLDLLLKIEQKIEVANVEHAGELVVVVLYVGVVDLQQWHVTEFFIWPHQC